MPHSDPKTLVSTGWLETRLGDVDLSIIDASWYLPAMQRNGRGEYDVAHIPGAVFFDIDEVSDTASSLPHMVPPVEKFVSRMRDLGIGNQQQIVVYDGAGLFSAARVWWLFRHMGLNNIAVLDGGLPKWIAEGRTVENEPTTAPRSHLAVTLQPDLVKNVADVAAASANGSFQIIDARAADRFRGDAQEPRAGLRSGHIPGSRNVFFKDLLTIDATMKPLEQLRQIFISAGVDLDQPLITSCGSGVTAAVLSLALERIGHDNHALYDGSWTEWGDRDDLDIETGEARTCLVI
ncbi:MAG: 3-mercaptopyruvate sulfurtransferase [Paracoccaceae bacterium]